MIERELKPGDSELIAAFLDRRLTDSARREFMARLDREEALYEVFVETVRYREETHGGAEVVRHPAAGRRLTWVVPASIAALLALAIGSVILLRGGGFFGERSYSRALVASGSLEGRLEEEWYLQGWTTFRGPDDPLGDETRKALRVGVHALDLEIALMLDRRKDAEELLGSIRFELGRVDLSEPLERSYAEILQQLESSKSTAEALERVEALHPRAREFLDFGYGYSLGRWAEAGKLAARSGDRELLRSRGFRATLHEARGYDWPSVVGRQLDLIETAIAEREADLDLAPLAAAFKAIIDAS